MKLLLLMGPIYTILVKTGVTSDFVLVSSCIPSAILSYLIYKAMHKEDEENGVDCPDVKKACIYAVISLILYGFGLTIIMYIVISLCESIFVNHDSATSESSSDIFTGGYSDHYYQRMKREAEYIDTYTNREVSPEIKNILNNPGDYDSHYIMVKTHELELEREHRQANGEEEERSV